MILQASQRSQQARGSLGGSGLPQGARLGLGGGEGGRKSQNEDHTLKGNHRLPLKAYGPLPGPPKYVNQWPLRLFLEALGHYFTYLWGPAEDKAQNNSAIDTDNSCNDRKNRNSNCSVNNSNMSTGKKKNNNQEEEEEEQEEQEAE